MVAFQCTPPIHIHTGERYQPFVVEEEEAELVYTLQYSANPPFQLGKPCFESGGNWTLHQHQQHPVIRIHTPTIDPYQIVVAAPDWHSGDIYCVGNHWRDQEMAPLGYPLEELLLVNYLAQGYGVLLHASAVKDSSDPGGDKGYLFSGVSGAGKSTMAELWEGQPDVTVLSDDRVVVREYEGDLWAYGTPWHGSARIGSPEAVRIDKIYVLNHAEANAAALLPAAQAASHLLVRSFSPLWDAAGMAFTMAFLERLVEQVSCYRLGFQPYDEIVEYVRCLS